MSYYRDDAYAFDDEDDVFDVAENEINRVGRKQSWVEERGGWGAVLISAVIAVLVFILVWWLASLSSASLSTSSGVQPVTGSFGSTTGSLASSTNSMGSSCPPCPPVGTGTAAPIVPAQFNRSCASRNCGGFPTGYPSNFNGFVNKGRNPALVTDIFGQTSPDQAGGLPFLTQSR